MDIILSVTKQTYKLTQGKMKKFLLTTSVILSGIFPIFNSNTPVLAQPVDPVYISPTTGGDSKCNYYLVRDKYGNIWECRRCSYGGPYCFKKE